MTYAKGWLRSVRPAKYRFTPAAAIADTADLVRFTPDIFDQWKWGSCFGHGCAGGGTTAFAAAGIPLGWVMSPAGIYRLTRCVTRARMGLDPETNPLTDTGSYPVDGFEALEQWGVKALGEVDSNHLTDCFGDAVNAEPTQSELEEDAEHLLTGQQLFTANDMASACSASQPVGFGMFVDTAFEQWDPTKGFIGAPKNPYDPNGGGHFTYVAGYTRAGLLAQDVLAALPTKLHPSNPDWVKAIGQAAAALPASTRINFGVNSWTKFWGLNGFYLFTDALVNDPQSGDLFAFKATMRST